jgi:prepilin-type N-terminal cleavage/methylation domain-containing protein
MVESDMKNEFYERGQKGYSIIELLVAILILTFGLTSIMGISAYISRANSISGNINVLAAAGQDQVDQLRSAIWTLNSDNDPRIAVGGSLTSNVDNHYSTRSSTPAGNLIVRWQVSAGPGTTGDVRTATIKVVQVNPPANLRDGYTISAIICRN